jgi:hypothetical protein
LSFLQQGGSPEELRDALARFFVTVAQLNTSDKEQNFSMLVHTSGKTQQHATDRATIEAFVHALIDSEGDEFASVVSQIFDSAQKLYPNSDPDVLTRYIVSNASRASLLVLNNKRDRKAAGDNPTNPSSPFTIIIGGNIVSRGVTFTNLLSMFFTRTVSQRLRQDTYIQRARMFGSRNGYLQHFEMTIPAQLYSDWHKCFVFHKLALATMKSKLGAPVWIGDRRVAVAANASIDKATVALDKGEMSFGMFDYSDELDGIVSQDQSSFDTLRKLSAKIGKDALREFLIEYIQTVAPNGPQSLAIHTALSIAGYGASADQSSISRDKGFLGKPQLEEKKFPEAVHHVRILYNDEKRAKVFYKFKGSVQFVENLGKAD